GFNPSDDPEDQILGAYSDAEFAVDPNLKRLRPLLPEALRRQHVLDFAGADAERERAERAMRSSVAVAANDRHPRLREAKLRPDHMHDSLLARSDVEQLEAKFRAIPPQRFDLQLRIEIRD